MAKESTKRATKTSKAQSEIKLDGTKKASLQTVMRLTELSRRIAKGMSRQQAIAYGVQEWNLSPSHAEKYYYSAIHSFVPEDAEKWREAIYTKNMEVLDGMLSTALERNDYKAANDIIKTINSMIGLSGNKVELKKSDGEQEQVITISFE